MKRVLWLTITMLLLAGCQHESTKRLNAPPHGYSENTTDTQGTFTYMADNAMLADMTITANDFYPHRAMLNTMGQDRLARYASLIDAYGGKLVYSDDDQSHPELTKQRLRAIRDFLAEAGIDTTADIVSTGIPGGDGMPATEATLIRTEEGTYKPGQNDGKSATGTQSGSGGTSSNK